MRVVAVSMVRNEIDIVEAFVRHTLAVVDQHVVLDNGSHDGTLDVLKSLRREGLPIELIEDPEPGKRQGERTTKLMREHALSKHGADWVLPIDADEFLVIGTGGLISADIRPDRPLELCWRSYVPEEADDLSERNPVVRIRHRLRNEGWPWAKVAVPRELAEQPGAQISEGNHGFYIGDTLCVPQTSADCHLAHFPIRGPGQYLAKVAIGYLNRLLVPGRQSDWGFQYREPFERLKRDPASVAAEFREAARRYALPGGATSCGETVCDPIAYLGGELRHTPAQDDSAWPVQWLAVFAESVAERCSGYAAGMSAEQRTMADEFAEVQRALYQQLYAKDDALRAAQDALSETRRHAEAAAATEGQLRAAVKDAERIIAEYVASLQRAGATEQEVRRVLGEVERELKAVRGSWAWRVGNLAVGPARWVKRLIRSEARTHGAGEVSRDSA